MNYFDKYEKGVIKNINKDNVNKIIAFLLANKCDYIDELLDDYLDIFTIEYNEFVTKFDKLNSKYNYNLIVELNNNMNILEELYYM